MTDTHDAASYGAYGVSFSDLSPQQQEIIIQFLNNK